MAITNFIKSVRDTMRNDAGINGDAQRIEQISWMLFLKIYDAKESDWEIVDNSYHSIIPERFRWRNWAVNSKTALTADPLLRFVNLELFPTLKSLPIDATTPIRSAIVRITFEDANQYMKDGVLLREVINVIDSLDFTDYQTTHAFGQIYETILKQMQSAGSAGEFYTPRALTDFMARIIEPKVGEKMADFACGTGGFIVSWLNELEKSVKTGEQRIEWSNSIFGIEKKPFPYALCVTNLLLHDIDSPNIICANALTKKKLLDYTNGDKFDVILMNPPYGGSEKSDVKNYFPSNLASSETADLFIALIMYRLKRDGRAAVIIPDGFLFGTDKSKVEIKTKLLREFNLHTIIRLPGTIFSPYTGIATNILFFNNERAECAKEGFSTDSTWFYRLDMPEGYKAFSKTKPMQVAHCEPIVQWWNDRHEIVIEEGNEVSRCYTAQELIENGCNFDLCKFPKVEQEILPPKQLLKNYFAQRKELEQRIDSTLKEIKILLSKK